MVDRGVGVPQQDLGPVFDKFHRVSEFGSSGGLGLGLAICKAVVEAHCGGSAWITILGAGPSLGFSNRSLMRLLERRSCQASTAQGTQPGEDV